jgi:hypothetical protein
LNSRCCADFGFEKGSHLKIQNINQSISVLESVLFLDVKNESDTTAEVKNGFT